MSVLSPVSSRSILSLCTLVTEVAAASSAVLSPCRCYKLQLSCFLIFPLIKLMQFIGWAVKMVFSAVVCARGYVCAPWILLTAWGVNLLHITCALSGADNLHLNALLLNPTINCVSSSGCRSGWRAPGEVYPVTRCCLVWPHFIPTLLVAALSFSFVSSRSLCWEAGGSW